MPFDDLRGYLAAIEEQGELQRIYKEVDRDLEVSAVLRRAGEKAVWCERIRGFDMPIVTNLFGNRQKVAIALGVPPERMLWEYIDRVNKPIKPRLVDDGPVHEVVWTGDEVDLNRLPIPLVHAQDGGRFISGGIVVSKDPEFGTNLSMQRFQVKGPAKTGIFIHRVMHLNTYYSRAEARNEPLPIAVVIGCDPTLYMASQAMGAPDLDEYTIAGGLRQKAVDLVKCKSVDLEVPAHAEIVLEGYIPPGEREPEGPFGEFPGYYGLGENPEKPVVHFTAISMRRNAVFQSVYLGKPPVETNFMTMLPKAAILHGLIKHAAAEVKDIYVTPGGCAHYHAIISIKKRFDGEARLALSAALSARVYFKQVIVVDDDIDIYNPTEVEWAVATRSQFDLDSVMLTNTPANLDPSAEVKRGVPFGVRVGIDATRPIGKPYPPVCEVPRDLLDQVDRDWEAYTTAPLPVAAGVG